MQHIMKAAYTTLLILLLLAVTAHAQPRVAYMIPDIGAPGMNTYVEIVAPHDASQTFGNSLISMNVGDGTDNVSVQPDNPADAARIVVGPVVVSWNGRLISTQIFVKPGAANGVVPLRITVGGQSTVINEFTIVTPQVLGTAGMVTGGGVLGEGALGTRSARGAMIVDQLILNGGVYRVRTQDSKDQFPFILLARRGLALINNATLSVDGSTLNAGPGGGGGAGVFCDQTFIGDGGPGSNGGAGFTSGGAGGRNSTTQPDSYNSLGVSTGANGRSLNGLDPGGYNGCDRHEGAAGGTGHPFGLSPAASCLPTQGGYGGGNTADDGGGGGGGGFGSDGSNGSGSGTSNNRGRLHGNQQGVPVAGGSGGGGGNPFANLGGCAGGGGGGGGAAVLYSMTFFNFSSNLISAKGGNGGNRTGAGAGAGGGAGSGGYIGVGAKVPTSGGGTGSISGGSGGTSGGGAGGIGRARYDGYTTSAPTFGGPSAYVGPTIDTLTYRDSATFVVSGTSSGTEQLELYMRGESSSWRRIATFTSRTWSIPVTVTEGSGLYYFVAVQVTESPSDASYLSVPVRVFSQAAANIVQVDLIPRINVNRTNIAFPDVSCETELFDTVKIWNTGDAPLQIIPSVTGDYSILPPYNTTFTINPGLTPPGDTVRMVIRFSPTAVGARPGRLTLANNDPRPGKNPTFVDFTGTKLDTRTSLTPRLIDFGDLCLDSSRVDSVIARVDGVVAGRLIDITRLGSGTQYFDIIAPNPQSNVAMPAGSSRSIVVRFRPTAPGVFADSFRVRMDPCDTFYVFVVRGRAINTSVQVTPNPINFVGGVVIGDPSPSIPVTIENTGTDPGVITDIFIRPAGAPFTAPVGLIGTTVNPGAGNGVTGNVTFTPVDVGLATGELVVVFGSLCPDTAVIDISGTGVRCAQPVPDRAGMDFGAVLLSTIALDTIRLENRTSDPMVITEVSVPTPWQIVSPVVPPSVTIAPSGTLEIIVSYTPTDTVQMFDSIIVRLSAPCPDSMRIPVTGRGRCARVESATTFFDFGAVIVGGSEERIINIINNSPQPMDISPVTVTPPWSMVPPVPTTVPAHGAIEIRVRFNPTDTAAYTGRLVVYQNTPCPDSLVIDLAGRGSCAVLSQSVRQIDFDRALVGTSKAATTIVTNNSTEPMEITAIDLPLPWTLDPPQTVPVTVPPGGSLQLTVRFTPTDSVSYNGYLVVHQSTPCRDSVRVELLGSGRIIVGGSATIVIPTTLQGSPGDRISIPLILRESQALRESEATKFQATVRFNVSMLYPYRIRTKGQAFTKGAQEMAVTDGSILSREVQGQDLLVTFTMQNNPTPNALDTLGFIDAIVALGNELTTPVEFDTLFWTNGEVAVTLEDGLFSLTGYCDEGGIRLFLPSPAFGIKSVSPNPFNPSAEISFDAIGDGGTSLVIYDLYGSPVETIVDNEPLTPGTYTRTWNAQKFPSGIYHAVLTSATLRSAYRLVLVK